MNETFDHREYHIYTTDSRLNKTHIHLTEDTLTEAVHLLEAPEDLPVSDDWEWTMRLPLKDNIFLAVKRGVSRYPRLESPGYEGWEPVQDGKFEDKVWFDSQIFHKSIGTMGAYPEYSFDSLYKNWVNPEHQDQFEAEFEDYLTMVKEKDRNTPVSVDRSP